MRRAWLLSYLALVVCHLIGCSVTRQIVSEQAASDLLCGPEQLSAIYLGHGKFTVSGCGETTHYGCDTGVCRRLDRPPRLDRTQSQRLVRAKAAALLHCEASRLTLTAGRSERYAAEGCGRNIEYECVSRADCCAFETPGERSVAAVRAAQREALLVRTRNEKHGSLSKLHIRQSRT